MRGHRDLELVTRASVLCVGVALILPFELLRAIFAAPLALLLPGYAIAAATFARRPIAWPPFLLLSLALSLASLALGSLLLNYVPGGIGEISWSLLLLLIVFNGCRVAALRRPGAPKGTPSWPRPHLGRTEGALLGGGLALIVAALVLAMTPLPAENALGYTELWISPARSDAGAAVARVGVRSQEKRDISYFLRVRFGEGKPQVRLLEMQPGESRAVRMEAVPPTDGPVQVTAALFRQAQPENVYRRVVADVPAAEAPR